MPSATKEYGPQVQKVPADTPLADILFLLKRDGGVFIRGLISHADIDKTYDEVRETLDNDVEWDGSFFPSMFLGVLLARTSLMRHVQRRPSVLQR